MFEEAVEGYCQVAASGEPPLFDEADRVPGPGVGHVQERPEIAVVLRPLFVTCEQLERDQVAQGRDRNALVRKDLQDLCRRDELGFDA